MAMPALRTPLRRWTEEEFYRARDAAPRGMRYELVDGELLVTPSPHWTHQGLVLELAVLLRGYVKAQSLGRVFTSPLDVLLEPGLVLQPDVLVVPVGELRSDADVVRRLLVAIEILSPSSARHDRVTKRPRYQRNRVPEYWVVDDKSQTVERWRPDDARPELLTTNSQRSACIASPPVGAPAKTICLIQITGVFSASLELQEDSSQSDAIGPTAPETVRGPAQVDT